MADEIITDMQGLLTVSDTEGQASTSSDGASLTKEDKKSVLGANAKETEGNHLLHISIELSLITSTEPLFELAIARGKGFGLFATRNIPRGTRIIKEVPLLVVPPSEGAELNLSDFQTALRTLDQEQQSKFFDLHRDHKVTSQAKQLLSQQSKAFKASQNQDFTDAVAIFLANCVQMGGGEYGSGVFQHYSRINHSCIPNVHNAYNPSLDRLTVHAVRQTNKGEEILTSYIDGYCRTHEQRQQSLNEWGFFKCSCRCCTGSRAAVSGKRRARMFEIDQDLAFYAAGLPPMLKPSVPRNPQAALKLSEELLDLCRSEAITDYNLTQW